MQLLTLFVLLIPLINALYELQSSFSGLTFFDNFQFYTSWDPTFGYVHYVDQTVAQQYGMLNITDTSVSWGVDTTQMLDPSANLGRLSIRLASIQSWTHGLFIIDLAHLPSNTCGAWPAMWMLGSGLWPTTGEIDIIEYVNNGLNNLMALHTSEGCTVAGADESGTLVTSDCGADGGITGCTVSSTQTDNSGDAFNANGGGVYAMEWTSRAIRMWFFPRDAIPESISIGSPEVSTFGTPAANFEGNCDIDAHFYNASIVFNIDFCGSYAGNVWQSNGCPMLDPENGWSSCNQFVALNPSAYAETYWKVNYLDVYQLASGVTPTETTALSSVIPAISTSSAVSTALSGALGRTTSFTMSLAGTTPTITTGSFSETSSVLSVLSSLASESEASTNSVSSSLVGRATSPSLLSIATTSGLPFSSATFVTSEVTSVPPPPIPSTLPATTSLPPPSVESQPPCTGSVCTSNVYVTVVQTITVGGVALVEIAPSPPPRKAVVTVHDLAQGDWNKFDRCNFEILPGAKAENRWTGYTYTLTREEILNGELVTATAIASTAAQSGTALEFGELLSIETIIVKTKEIAQLTPIRDYGFTGTFTPAGTAFLSTTITACPESKASNGMRLKQRDRQSVEPVTLTTIATSVTTASGVNNTAAPDSSQYDGAGDDPYGCVSWTSLPIVLFFLFAVLLVGVWFLF